MTNRKTTKTTKTIEQPIEEIKAFKCFLPDWTAKHGDFKFEVGQTYKHAGKVKLCSSGFHASVKPQHCFNYYDFDPANKVAEVILRGTFDKGDENSDKIAASEIEIVREISWIELLGLVNNGTGNTGHSNSGDRNSGYSNSGYSNSGDRNSGDRNSGDRNSGDRNSGYRNSGYRNSGDRNSGDSNSGDRNSGYRNSGDRNSGDRNSGDSNSGDSNSGDSNSGYRNSGDSNSGYGNSANRSSGIFCTEESLPLCFNKPSNLLWADINHPSFWNYDLTLWVESADMTEAEKADNPNFETRGGYLKTLSYQEMFSRGWAKDSDKNKVKFMGLPNFDLLIFQSITGLDVTADYERLIQIL